MTVTTNDLVIFSQFSTLFSFMGTNLQTLLPFFESQFSPTGNYVTTVPCLGRLDGLGTLTLVRGLTNESPSFLRWILYGGMSEGKMKSLVKKGDPYLESIYKEADRSLFPLVRHSDPVIRTHALRCLPFYATDSIKVSSVLRELIQTDDDEEVRCFAILALVNMYVRDQQLSDEDQLKRDVAMMEQLDEEEGAKKDEIRKCTRFFISQIDKMNKREGNVAADGGSGSEGK